MTEILTLTDAELDLVNGGQVSGGAGGYAVAISLAAIIVRGNNSGTLTATSGATVATGGDGGAAADEDE